MEEKMERRETAKPDGIEMLEANQHLIPMLMKTLDFASRCREVPGTYGSGYIRPIDENVDITQLNQCYFTSTQHMNVDNHRGCFGLKYMPINKDSQK